MTEQERQTLMHEAGHASAALTQGLPVTEVSLCSSDPSRYLGWVHIPLDALTDSAWAREVAIMVLCGPLSAEQPLPTWPLSDNNTSDERLLKVYCEYLDLDEAGYKALVQDAVGLCLTRKFKRICLAIETWLEQVPRMDASMVVEAMALAWLPADRAQVSA